LSDIALINTISCDRNNTSEVFVTLTLTIIMWASQTKSDIQSFTLELYYTSSDKILITSEFNLVTTRQLFY